MPKKTAALSSLISDRMQFSDIDEYSEIHGWSRDYRQLSSTNSVISVELIASTNVIIKHLHFPFAIHQQGLSSAGYTNFGLPFSNTCLSWSNRECADAVLVDFNHPGGFDAVSEGGFRGVTISVSDDTLSRNAELMGLQETSAVGIGEVLLRSGSVDKLDELRQYLKLLCGRNISTLSLQEKYGVLTELENEVPFQLLTSLAERRELSNDIPLWARQKGLRLAIKFIEEKAHDNPRMPDICAASNLSWRSLDRVFKEYFGIGPKRYLLQLRLIRVRQQLKKVAPNAKISDVANAWGFWHMGDFAQKYRRLFGELPAEQLVKSYKFADISAPPPLSRQQFQ